MTENQGHPLLAIEDLVAGYRDVPVVRGLSLTVSRGEIVALLGANGAGKTTTLLTISGLLEPLGGHLRVLDVEVRNSGSLLAMKLARRGVALVPDDRGLFPDLTVRENLIVATGSKREPFEGLLELFPRLADLSNRRVSLLSGGEQQMLAIARALRRQPKLLMVDELSLGLAPIIVEQLMPTLRTVAENTQCGVLIVEQHVGLALQVADRAHVLHHGELVLSGTADELRADSVGLEGVYLGSRAEG